MTMERFLLGYIQQSKPSLQMCDVNNTECKYVTVTSKCLIKVINYRADLAFKSFF